MSSRKDQYAEYLRSPAWQEKRAKVRERRGNRCAVCRSPIVEVHHKTYRNVGGGETMHQMVLLCREHHQGAHDFAVMWRTKGYRPLSLYSLSMKYISRERKKARAARLRAQKLHGQPGAA